MLKYHQLFRFLAAWEQRKLGEVFDTVTDYVANGSFKSLRDNVKSYTKENYAYMIRLQDASNNWKGPWLYTDKAGYSFLTKSKLHPNDIIMSNVGSVGKFFLIPELDKPMTLAPNAVLIKSSKNNALFLYQMMISTPMQVAVGRKTTPGVQLKINKTDFKRIQTNLPSLNEQEKIGEFFKQLDSLITLHQRKLEHLQEQKKGLLQKMFPKNGETVPEVRFPGFTDAWEQRKLGEVADIFDGTHQTPKYTDSGIKFVSVENIATLETEKYISQKAYESEYSNKQAEKGDVLMTRIGNIGTPKLIEKDEPLAYYVTLALLKPKNIDSNFLVWGISSPKVQRNIWKLTLHIAFPKKINLGEINQVSISIPSINEQKKIGDFFKQLDSLIALHQRKLDHLELMKKGLLQQMFV